MPLIAFVDYEVSEELEKINSGNNEDNSLFPEHEFIATILKIGLTISDIKELTYVDVVKIIISFLSKKTNKNENKMATQQDIDKILG